MADKSEKERFADLLDAFEMKYDFFFVGLTFAILALAIQTSPEPIDPVSVILELLGQVSLLASSIFSLAYLRLKPTQMQNVLVLLGINDSLENTKNEGDMKKLVMTKKKRNLRGYCRSKCQT